MRELRCLKALMMMSSLISGRKRLRVVLGGQFNVQEQTLYYILIFVQKKQHEP